jgi:DNA-directed RNA polymerase subunit M/transcription elongation factor TFIIS
MDKIDKIEKEKETFVDMVLHSVGPFLHTVEYQRQLAAELLKISGEDLTDARYLLYEMIVDLSIHPNLRLQMENLGNGLVLWDHPNLRTVREGFQEQDAFIEQPPEIDEGIIQCKRCKSNRTFSFSKQTRRGDESTTVFVRCSKCSFSFRL